MKNLILNFPHSILNFLFPPRCPVCAGLVTKNGQLCLTCWNKFNWISNPKCIRCGYPFPANIDGDKNMLCAECVDTKSKLDWMRSASVYDDASRDVMLPFKHGNHFEYRNLMSRAMMPLINELPPAIASDFIILPIPLSYRRIFKRGYNQAALLAKPIAIEAGARIDFDSVRRIHRADMGHKNSAERARNIAGVFKCVKPENIRGKNILLIDDVFTTGATFNELAKVLKRAGANWVGGLTFCRTVRAI